jgi:hypothetical protein
MVVNRGFDSAGRVPGLAQPHDAAIGMYLDEYQVWKLTDSDRLDLGNLQVQSHLKCG